MPAGVNRGLWDYLHNPDIARSYDAYLAGSHLPRIDVEFAARHFPGPGRLVDLGCGTGRLLVPFARRGFRTLGVDLSLAMLHEARARAESAGVDAEFLQANLADLHCLDGGAFDYAACLFSTLGMLIGRDAREKAMHHVHRILRPGGVFVLHVHNRWFNLRLRQTRWWFIKDAMWSFVGRGGDHPMPAHQGIPGLTLHLFTRREIVKLLRAADFRIREILPLSLRPDGHLRCAWCLGRLRAYGYLLAAQKGC
jgi:SAM-dependent methyltransferase